MVRRWYPLVAAVLALLPSSVLGADEPGAAAPPQPQDAVAEPAGDGAAARGAGQPTHYARWLSPYPPDLVIRFGWWAVDKRGSLTKIGEYQDLESSPFWNVDGLLSDGNRTVDFFATGTDNEGTQGHVEYFGPRLSAKIDYDRYLRRLDRDFFTNFDPNTPPPPAPAAQRVLNRTVLNAGENYAIRVQEFDTRFKGPLGENAKWRLNVWGMRKEGERQATALGHCFNSSAASVAGHPSYNPAVTGSRCHIMAQRQRIDWTTSEIEPVIETTLGPIMVEYSRTMRVFNQDDGTPTRRWTQSHDGWPVTGTDIPYDTVAENYTQIDRLKLSTDLSEYNHAYALMYVGDTTNRLRDTQRFISGFDVRLTNDYFDGLKLTGYGKRYNEAGQLPSTFPEAPLIQGGNTLADYHRPLSYEKTAAGLKGNWKPYASGWPVSRGLGLTAGYEYSLIHRSFAEYEYDDPRFTPPLTGEFTQPDTVGHLFQVGLSRRWSACFDTSIRYKFLNTDNPIYGFRATSGDVNTNQPNQTDLVELGFTWTPSASFLLSGTFGIEKRRHHSLQDNLTNAYILPAFARPNPRETDFDEDNFPIVVSAWYAVNCKWSLTGGYASFSNTIDQLITLGDQYDDGVYSPGAPLRNNQEPDPFQGRWRYSGRAQIVNLGTAYAYSQRVKLSLGYEYGWSNAGFASPPSPATSRDWNNPPPAAPSVVPDWTLIPSLSVVRVDTHRVTAGIDYLLRERITLYLRYSHFDYTDFNVADNSGSANMYLGGISALF